MPTRKVLVPLDRSEYGKKILPQVIKFIQPVDTEIILFHAAHEPHGIGLGTPQYELDTPGRMRDMPSKGGFPHPIYPSQEEDAIQSQFEVEVLVEVDRLRKSGFEVSVEVYFGDPKKEILNIIAEKKIDLVAMTTHAREGLDRLIFGSVAEHILRHVSIPILMMHPS